MFSRNTTTPSSPTPAASVRSTAVGGGGGGSSTRDCTRQPQGTGAATDSAAAYWKGRFETLLVDCGIHGAQAWDHYVAQIRSARRDAGQPLTRW